MVAQLNFNKTHIPVKIVILWILLSPFSLLAQQNKNDLSDGKADTTLQSATLENCIHYAIQHNPDLANAKLNEEITETTIKTKLADWYPQVNFNYNLQHNFQLPTLNFNGNLIHTGTVNTSGVQFGRHKIFSTGMFY